MKTNLICLRKITGLLPVLLAIFFLVSSTPVNAGSPKKREPVKKWEGYLEFLGKPGTARSLGQTDLFVPLAQDENDMTFFNQRSQIDDNDQSEHNFGIGHRHMFDEWILGGYGYYDTRNSAFGNDYSQGTFGLEALSENFDFRVNGYYVEDKVNDTGADVLLISGNQVSILASAEKALPGFDGEVGYKLPVLGFLEDTRLYVGGYHFIGDSMFESVSGPRARLEARVHDLPWLGAGSRLMMGVETQYDDPRGSQTFGLVSVRIPFGVVSTRKRTPLKGLDRRMMQPVVRDVDIVTTNGNQSVDALNPAGEKYDRIEYWENRDDVEAQLGAGEDGETILGVMMGGDGGWGMTDFETKGGGISYVIAGKETPIGYYSPAGSKRTMGFTPEGTAPKMTWDGDTQSLITLKVGDHINGWDMNAPGGTSPEVANGLVMMEDSPGNYYITNTTITNVRKSGVRVEGDGRTLYISDSFITGSYKSGGKEHDSGGLYAKDGGRIFAHNVELEKNRGMGAFSDGADSYIKITGDYLGSSTANNNAIHGLYAQRDGKIFADNMIIEGNEKSGVFSGHASFRRSESYIYIEDSIIKGNEKIVRNPSLGGALLAIGGGTIDGHRLLITDNFGHGVASYGDYIGESDTGNGVVVKTSVNIFDSTFRKNGIYDSKYALYASDFLQSIIHVENSIFEDHGNGIARSVIDPAWHALGQENSIIRLYNNTFKGYRGYDVEFGAVHLNTTFEGSGNKEGEGNDVPLVEFHRENLPFYQTP